MSDKKKVHRNEIIEESRYVVDCPYCGNHTNLDDYDYSDSSGSCEICNKDFDIVED